jgi:hypothetical protein
MSARTSWPPYRNTERALRSAAERPFMAMDPVTNPRAARIWIDAKEGGTLRAYVDHTTNHAEARKVTMPLAEVAKLYRADAQRLVKQLRAIPATRTLVPPGNPEPTTEKAWWLAEFDTASGSAATNGYVFLYAPKAFAYAVNAIDLTKQLVVQIQGTVKPSLPVEVVALKEPYPIIKLPGPGRWSGSDGGPVGLSPFNYALASAFLGEPAVLGTSTPFGPILAVRAQDEDLLWSGRYIDGETPFAMLAPMRFD